MEVLLLVVGVFISCLMAWDEEPLWDLTDLSGAQLLLVSLAASAVLLDLRASASSGAYAPLDSLAVASSLVWTKSMGAYALLIFVVLSAHLMAPAMTAHQDPSLAYVASAGSYGSWPAWAVLGLASLGALGSAWGLPGVSSWVVGVWLGLWILGSVELTSYTNSPTADSVPGLASTSYWGEEPGVFDWSGSASLPRPLLFGDELLFWGLLLLLMTQAVLSMAVVAMFLTADSNSSDSALVMKMIEAGGQLLALMFFGGALSALSLSVGCLT